MRIWERELDFHRRASFKKNKSPLPCGIPFSPLILCSGKRFSYDKLPQEPLRLSVLKLDGSSFDIDVERTATVAELRGAVEAAFNHLPKMGPGKVSWPHVWGQFCLSYDGQKLLTDSDRIGSYGIKEGDQLQFIRHTTISYDLIRSQSEKVDRDPEKPRRSITFRPEKYVDRRKIDRREELCCSHQEQSIQQHSSEEDCEDDEDDWVVTRCEYRLAHLLRSWFSYRRVRARPKRSSHGRSCSNSPELYSGSRRSFRSVVRCHSNKRESSREQVWKGE